MGISLEVLEPDGAPQVGITVSGLDPASGSVISVEVSWDQGESWHGVRGVKEVDVASSAFFRDFVPPLNVEATYRLVVHEGAIEPEPTEATVTVVSDRAWIQDPLNPRSVVPIYYDAAPDGEVWLMSGSLASATYAQAVDRVVPEGARYPVSSVGQRLAAGQVPINLAFDVIAEAGRLRNLLATAGQVVLRGLPDGVLDPVAHVTLPDPVERRVGSGTHQVAVWELEATQERPTSLKVVVPWWTYADVAALVEEALGVDATYAGVMAAAPDSTYLDWLRRPDAVLGLTGTPYGEGEYGEGFYGY